MFSNKKINSIHLITQIMKETIQFSKSRAHILKAFPCIPKEERSLKFTTQDAAQAGHKQSFCKEQESSILELCECCIQRSGSQRCENCRSRLYCEQCFLRIHQKGKFQFHTAKRTNERRVQGFGTPQVIKLGTLNDDSSCNEAYSIQKSPRSIRYNQMEESQWKMSQNQINQTWAQVTKQLQLSFLKFKQIIQSRWQLLKTELEDRRCKQLDQIRKRQSRNKHSINKSEKLIGWNSPSKNHSVSFFASKNKSYHFKRGASNECTTTAELQNKTYQTKVDTNFIKELASVLDNLELKRFLTRELLTCTQIKITNGHSTAKMCANQNENHVGSTKNLLYQGPRKSVYLLQDTSNKPSLSVASNMWSPDIQNNPALNVSRRNSRAKNNDQSRDQQNSHYLKSESTVLKNRSEKFFFVPKGDKTIIKNCKGRAALNQ